VPRIVEIKHILHVRNDLKNILSRYSNYLVSSEQQFGIKAKSSTNPCSMILKESITCIIKVLCSAHFWKRQKHLIDCSIVNYLNYFLNVRCHSH